jgi:DNA-binding response OmpR family regulator/HPt (histidine-containing phosphotransfer) domain-containing protein
MRILVVEDDETIADLVKTALTEQHYTVDIATDGYSGWQLAEDLTYDLILLDVMLPKLDGISFCQRLRRQGNQAPVLLLTAKSTSNDKVAGLDAGADDYIVKPLDLQELAARIRALLRRGHGTASPVLTWGDLRFNPQSCEVLYGAHPLHLTPKEYALLELFLRNAQRVFNRSAILDQLWAFDDEPPGEDTVKTHVKGLRQKLKAVGAAELIETVYGLGYRLNPSYLKSCTTNASSVEKQPEQTRAAVAKIWERAKGKILQRIHVLEQATETLSNNFSVSNSFSVEENLQQARQEVHKLVGALGTFGIQAGTQISRQIEELLEQQPPLNALQWSALQSFVKQLKQAVENADHSTLERSALSEINAEQNRNIIGQCQLLTVGNNQDFLERLVVEAPNWGVQVAIATDFDVAKIQLEQTQPAIVLFDLPLTALEDEALKFLTGSANRASSLPVIALTEFNQLADRLAVSRLKGWHFLEKPTVPSQVFTLVTQVLKKTQKSTITILAVDDDPLILTTLQTVLKPWGINVFTLQTPQIFWQRLPEVMPDLIMLDVEMPDVNGIELCQTLRDDIRWSWLPVLFLTARTDANTIAQIFAAGADDYINKPILAPELVARILNRLERQRSLRSYFETNYGSDTGDSQQFMSEVNRFLKLAKRFQQPLCLAVLEVTQRLPLHLNAEADTGSTLMAVGRLLRQRLHDEDILTRWKKNQWIIGLYGMSQRESVEWLATILETLRATLFNAASKEQIGVTLTIGVAQYPEDGATWQLLYQSAETLLAHTLPETDRILPVGWQPQPQDSPQTDILLVHHDEVFAASVTTALALRGYHYRWLPSGKTALSAIEGTAPALSAKAVLWAGDLPDIEILPFLKRWKKNKLARHTRLILLLPETTVQIDKLLELGAFDYVMTPCSSDVLMQCLYRSLEFAPR